MHDKLPQRSPPQALPFQKWLDVMFALGLLLHQVIETFLWSLNSFWITLCQKNSPTFVLQSISRDLLESFRWNLELKLANWTWPSERRSCCSLRVPSVQLKDVFSSSITKMKQLWARRTPSRENECFGTSGTTNMTWNHELLSSRGQYRSHRPP